LPTIEESPKDGLCGLFFWLIYCRAGLSMATIAIDSSALGTDSQKAEEKDTYE
jgi:hypothetical protein